MSNNNWFRAFHKWQVDKMTIINGDEKSETRSHRFKYKYEIGSIDIKKTSG